MIMGGIAAVRPCRRGDGDGQPCYGARVGLQIIVRFSVPQWRHPPRIDRLGMGQHPAVICVELIRRPRTASAVIGIAAGA